MSRLPGLILLLCVMAIPTVGCNTRPPKPVPNMDAANKEIGVDGGGSTGEKEDDGKQIVD